LQVPSKLSFTKSPDFLRSNDTLEELHMCGADRAIFDILDFVQALETTSSLKRLVLRQLDLGSNRKPKGMQVDKSLEEKLKKIVQTNGHLNIYAHNDAAFPKEITIVP
jgi:hypothetical protein